MNVFRARSVQALPHRFFLIVGLLLTSLQCSRERRDAEVPIAQQEARPIESWIREANFARIELSAESDGKLFQRLQQRLGDLQEAGFTVLWLSSVFPSSSLNQQPASSDPFPTQDYRSVSENFGTLEEFKSLVNNVFRRGMRIIIDLQARYTAWDSRLVMEHPDWFRTNEEGAILSPSPELSDVAALNYRHHELRKYMIEVMKYWVREVRVDGFACLEADQVPLDFWIRARKEIEKIKPVLFLAQSDRGELHREAFDATFSSDVSSFLLTMTDASSLEQMLKSEAERFPRNALRLRLNRPLNTFPQTSYRSQAKAYLDRLGAVLAYTLPGNPVAVISDSILFDQSPAGGKALQLYSTLSRLTKEYAASVRGVFRATPLTGVDSLFSYERRLSDESVLVLLNLSSQRRHVSLQLPVQFSGLTLDYLAQKEFPTKTGVIELQCMPYEAKIIIRSSKGKSS